MARMLVVHGHRGPLGPYVGPHTLWDPVAGPHIFVGPDGRVSGVRGAGGLVRVVLGVSRRVSLLVCGGGGVCLVVPLAPLCILPMPFGLLVGGEEEVPGHLVKSGAA